MDAHYSTCNAIFSVTVISSYRSPPKIKTIRIIDNPFDDIVPRITAEEKRAQQRARAEAMKEREEAERRKGAKKYVKSAYLVLTR